MVVDLMKYTAVLPMVQRMVKQYEGTDIEELCSRIAIATYAPCIVVNRYIAAINGETEDSIRQRETLTTFYKYTSIEGEDALKELLNNANKT